MEYRNSIIVRRIFISFICFGLLLGLLWGYLHFWNIQPNAPQNAQPTIPGKWKLTFDDEFNGPVLDESKWNTEDYKVGEYRNCCLNYGVQYFTPQALSLANGSLQIKTAQQEMGTRNYTSGAITTENKFSLLYGRVDVRAKLPKTQGLWPAIWLLPYDTNANLGGVFEIDMMELNGSHPNVIHMTNHWGKQQAYRDYTGGPDYSQNYHIFSIVWTRQTITWYIDGIARFQVSQHVSNKSLYLIINASLGGRYVGKPDSSTVLPQYMNIDYVRVYKPAS
ncbi:MAG TPA: glycoside hydrolase family 16 protein [Ktedonobacteraceae bacterium]|nr:glycoside hydrolase family 16 protein [Ktedonobacteraceae bacterium]